MYIERKEQLKEPKTHIHKSQYHVQITYAAIHWPLNLDVELNTVAIGAMKRTRGLGYGQVEEHYYFDSYENSTRFMESARAVCFRFSIEQTISCNAAFTQEIGLAKIVLTPTENMLYLQLKKKQVHETKANKHLIDYLGSQGVVKDMELTDEGRALVRTLNKRAFALYLQPIYETGKLTLFGNSR